jgi:hypothetical protein
MEKKKLSVEITAFWGNDDACSTIKIKRKLWDQILAGAEFSKSAIGYYEGAKFSVEWEFSNKEVTIIGDDGFEAVSEMPVSELIANF